MHYTLMIKANGTLLEKTRADWTCFDIDALELQWGLLPDMCRVLVGPSSLITHDGAITGWC